VESAILVIKSVKLRNAEFSKQSVVGGHIVDRIEQVVYACESEQDFNGLGRLCLAHKLLLFSLEILVLFIFLFKFLK